MKRKRIGSFLMVLFLMVGSVQIPVCAKTETLESERVILTEENRYNPEYYGEPKVYYPDAAKGMARSAGTEQTLEEYVVAALENFETTIDISAYHVPKDTAAQEYFKILNNNPQLFYVKGAYNGSYIPGEDTILSYNVTYLYERETAASMREELEAAADRAVSQVDTSLDDYQQVLTVHDYLVQNCEYDYENYLANQVPDISHTAYGSLVNGAAVCDGYADAFSYIMEHKLGIPCEVISSDSMAHAWNMIEIGGKWYHVDATWDDPAWDCIGKVSHEYFLLSDSRISDSVHDHKGWSADHTADYADYDNAFWTDIKSAICYANGAWYYSKYQLDGDFTKAVKLVKKDGDQLLADSEDTMYETSPWIKEGDSYYPASYMYLARVGQIIYFNTRTEIYQVNTDGTVERFYSPEDLSDLQIYGFTARENESEYELWYAPDSTPNFSEKQTDIRKYSLPKITGITAENIRGDYNGWPYTIEVNGVQPGDTVQYALTDGSYRSDQPEMKNAGTYVVRYQVKRNGYAAFFGEVTVTIEPAVPQYELPTGCAGSSGDRLADIALPDGFAWQEPDTVLCEEGTQTYQAAYTPEDSENYQTVIVDVAVKVTCPGHKYTSEVTREPSETEKGIRTYTCSLCGDSYTEEIDKLLALTGIDAEDVTGTYTGEPYTITVKGTEAGDTIMYALKNSTDTGEAVYAKEQPKMINAGTYEVLYKVTRTGYQPFVGSVRVEIARANPDYTVPTNLKGYSGMTLNSTELPEGFAWQEPDTVLREEGTQTYQAAYIPEDSENYQSVIVEVLVEVTCPGHKYTSEVTREPSETEKGIRTYTCSLCKDSYTEEIDKLLALTGIDAEDVTGIYTGEPYTITVKGTEAGDTITYALKNSTDTGEAVYAKEQPKMINAGTYEVLYKVTRTGYQPFVGSVRVEIARANPDYTVPTNLKGYSGTTLNSIELPEGFFWQTDADTKLDKPGYQKFYVCYRPKDQLNYRMVTDIEVEIEVVCPGHQYDSVITKAATETQKGLKTYTCKLCGDVYTEEIDMLSPAKPSGVSGLKITKRTTNSLSFSWNAASGISYCLMFYKGNQAVSTEFVTGSAYTYKNLNPAAIYTLQVTPYRIVNGQKIFADAAGILKTATSPAKAKLRKAKRVGDSKVKLTWKKVADASGYEIFMKTGSGKYKKIKTIGNGKTISFTKKKLSKKKTCSFRIRAYTTVNGKKIYGANSNVKKVK